MNDKLGALEFASTLNGDDAEQVLIVLNRFVKTIRNERTQAFSSEDDHSTASESDSDYLSDSEEEDDDDEKRPRKKGKMEKWKLDTKSYNVPFVGTSTHKGSTGVVQIGCWPTGFLEVYLVQSPQAMEILGSDFQRLLTKGNDKMRCAFIQAMGELVSSAIPLGKIDDLENMFDLDRAARVSAAENEVNLSYQRIISIVMKEHQKDVLHVLNEHAFSRSNQSLLISALKTLNYLAMTSVGTAREIARGLDTHLKDGVLHKLSTYTVAAKKKKENTEDINMDSEKDNSKQQRIGLKVQSVFLDLTASLLQYDDPAILSYITNAGGKDSKLKAGALYHGLRAGLSKTKKFLDTYDKSATNSTEELYQLIFFNVLRSMKKSLYKSDEKKDNTDNSHKRRSLSNKAQLDLIKGSMLENLIEIGYTSLKDTGDEDDSYLPDIKSECKEIVEILLCDVDISPLLKQINSRGATDATMLAVLQQTGKAMHTLLTTSPTLDTRKFAVTCFHGAPKLFQYWLRTVSLPDIKPNYACLATFSLISFMLKNGPDLPAGDLQKIQSSDKKKAFDIIFSFTAPRALTKNVLTKGIQSSNPLLVTETLKSLSIVLSRFDTMIEKNLSGENCEYAAEKLLTKMPDLQVLLAVRSKFDPYSHDTSAELARHHNFVVMNICEVLCLFAHTLPMSFRTVQFEWIKFLSDTSATFLSGPLSLQHRILTTLLTINDCYNRVAPQSNSMSSTKAYHAFTSILLNTKNDIVYQLARQLVHMTILNVVNTSHIQDEQSDHHVDYEICLWLDGVTASTAVMFGKLLSAAQKVTIQHKTIVSNAWEAHFPNENMPAITITSLLVLSLTALVSSEGNVPNDFIILIRDISTKILLKQSDRRMIAAILDYLSNAHHGSGTATEKLEDVFKFASAVLTELPGTVDEFELQAAEGAFGKKHFHTTVAKLARKEMNYGLDFKGLFGTCGANDVGCEIACQSIRHLSKGGQAKMICSYALPHCLFGGGHFGEHVTDQILNSQSSVLVCLLFTYFTTNHDQERQRFICDKIMNSLKKMVEEGSDERKARTSMNQVLLLVSGLLNDFTAESMGSITGTLSGICFDLAKDEIRRPYCALLLKTAKTSSSFKDYIGSLTSTDVDYIFILWNSLSQAHHKGSPKDSIEVPLLLKLEKLMGTMLANSEIYCLQSATVIKCIHESGADAIVDLAYNNLVHDELETKNGGPDETRCGFLESLMIYDASLFSLKIVERAVAKIYPSGEFRLKDEIIIAVGIREVLHQKQCHMQKWQSKASAIVIDRFCSILQHLIDDAIFHESTEIMIDVVSRMWTLNQLDTNSKEKAHSQVASLILHWTKLKWREIPKSTESAILTFIYTIESCPGDHVENKSVVSLRNLTLSYMVKMLPKAIKVGDKQKKICDLMISVTKKLVTVDQICTLKSLPDILIVCLKFGIGSGVAQISSQCLEISRILISNVYAYDSTEKSIACFTPHQIHSMILTHSNFDTVAGQRSETRKELLSLLIACVSLTNEPIDYNGDKLRVLLMAFDASVSQEDLLLRRLLSLYEAGNDSDQEPQFFLHDLVWGESDVSHSENLLIASDFGHVWENFIEKLDIKRIQKTIDQFPLWDPVKPLPIQDIEPWACKAEDNSIKEKIDNSDSEDESISSSGSSREDNNTENPKVSNHDVNIGQNTIYARDADERYSPGFIMPMILGTLESFRELADNSDEEELSVVSDEESHRRKRSFTDGKSRDKMTSNPAKESFAKVAHRLSQKGVLALCIACLSSKCPALRSTAVAVSSHFLQAIQSKEAQHIVEWKSRSQLDMAISSIQRSLMVIRAKQILQRNEGEKRILLIPMLPNVSSLFLARSLLTLTKPADDLYSAINKSFLRLSDHHGAFTDCNSLPAFISLFCSANDSPDQARKERIWALNLLKDGTVDSYSYKMASRRHAPELLLTSFDALLAREDSKRDDTECILLLETIEALIKQGESSSIFHYFHVVGLPAWMQSLLHSIALDIDAKSPRVIAGFMQLINTVIEKIADESSRESESDRYRPPTALNAINIARNVTGIVASLRDDRTEIVQHAYGILCSLHRIHDQHQPGTCNNSQFHPHGLLVESCLQIIQSVKTLVTCDPKMLIVAFCSFPLEGDCSKEGASIFALEALQAILSGGGSNNCMALNSRQCLSILHRLSALSSFVKDEDSYCAIIDNLIGCRRILVTKHGLSSEWLICLKNFVNDYSRSSPNRKKHSSYTGLLNTFATITERD